MATTISSLATCLKFLPSPRPCTPPAPRGCALRSPSTCSPGTWGQRGATWGRPERPVGAPSAWQGGLWTSRPCYPTQRAGGVLGVWAKTLRPRTSTCKDYGAYAGFAKRTALTPDLPRERRLRRISGAENFKHSPQNASQRRLRRILQRNGAYADFLGEGFGERRFRRDSNRKTTNFEKEAKRTALTPEVPNKRRVRRKFQANGAFADFTP